MNTLLPALLPIFGALWVTGFLRREARKSIWHSGNTIVGAAGMFAVVVWLWKNRRDAISVVAVTVLALSTLALVAAWYLVPEWRLSITAPVLVAGLCAYMWWDHKHTGWQPLGVVLAGKREEVRVRRAVQDTHEHARPRAAHRTENGWRVDVDHTGKIEPELVGQRLQVGGATVVPTERLGRSTIVLDDTFLGEWEAFRAGSIWAGPSSLKAGAPVPFAVSESGADVTVPWPGSGGSHLLGAGATGSGKSVLLRVLIAEMAYRENVTLVLCDPKMVEFRGWAARAHVARGVDESGRMFDAVFAEMMRRYETMPEDQVEWTDDNGPWIELVVDELGGITTIGTPKERSERERQLGLILAMGRAAGIGVVGFTQRPSHNVLSMDLRDNFRVRVGLGCESAQQTAMVMGDSAEKAPCTSIPESLPGACFVRVDRKVQRARVKFLDPSRVREVAAETAKYKGADAWLNVR
jgi:DNA segregation ATPase FtsK/SpoIIIE, S-DNA-T family